MNVCMCFELRRVYIFVYMHACMYVCMQDVCMMYAPGSLRKSEAASLSPWLLALPPYRRDSSTHPVPSRQWYGYYNTVAMPIGNLPYP